MTICWGNRNTSEFRDGYYIGACVGPGYDELRHPADMTARYIHHLEREVKELKSASGSVGGSLEEIKALGT